MAAHATGVSFTGGEHISTYDSSDWAERAFCAICGSALYYRVKESGMLVVSVGLFDDAEAFRMTGEIFIDRKPGGYDFAGDHPRLTEAETFAQFAAG